MIRKRKKSSLADLNAAGMFEAVLGCKWSLTVIDLVHQGTKRPGAMEKAVEGLTAKVLNERLRKLCRFGILAKTSFPEVPPRVEYDLTAFGQEFVGILTQIHSLEGRRDRVSAGPKSGRIRAA